MQVAEVPKIFKLIKVLDVHVVTLLSRDLTELNIDLKVRNAGLLGMCLLYLGHMHKNLNKSLTGELKSFDKIYEKFVADESSRIIVGRALGLNNLNTNNNDPSNQDCTDIDTDLKDDSLHGVLSFNEELYISDETIEYSYKKSDFFNFTNKFLSKISKVNSNATVV